MAESQPVPDVKHGLDYWTTQSADYNGVLGGFGEGSLPRVDALGSRQFLMTLMPELCTVRSALRPLSPPPKKRRVRALDVGAGVGRVTGDTLLPLVDDVVLVEPVTPFVQAALARGRASESPSEPESNKHTGNGTDNKPWRGVRDRTKGVSVIQGTLQSLDPAAPLSGGKLLGTVGRVPDECEMESGFDVLWCQWCLGHLSETELVEFFQRAKSALRKRDSATGESESLLVVKENCCSDGDDGTPRTNFDPEDSSLTRSDLAWKQAFKAAGLSLIREQVQGGFPDGLYVVKMYALRSA